MILYELIIYLIMTVGSPEPTIIAVPKLHPTLEDCQAQAQELVEWFTQDFVRVEAECRPVELREWK